MLQPSQNQSNENSGKQEMETDLKDWDAPFFSPHIYQLVWKIYQFPAFHFGNLLCQISLLGKPYLGTEVCDE